MKAIRIHAYGGADVLKIEDVAIPQPGPGEILVRVAAVGVNPVDWKIRGGHVRAMMDPPMPQVLGSEASGTIEAIGSGVEEHSVGDEVIVHTGLWGAYAEYFVTGAANAVKKPANLSFERAGNVGMSVQTAWGAITDGVKLTAGEKILILGASGAVGRAAVQIAKKLGADVYGTSSARNSEKIKVLGATPIAYDAPGGPTFPTVDVILDLAGGEAASAATGALKPDGRYVTCVSPMEVAVFAERGFDASFYGLGVDTARLRATVAKVAEGVIELDDPIVFSFNQVAEAHALSEGGHPSARIILKPAA